MTTLTVTVELTDYRQAGSTVYSEAKVILPDGTFIRGSLETVDLDNHPTVAENTTRYGPNSAEQILQDAIWCSATGVLGKCQATINGAY